jgi:putative component of membrane protein insertase Oxa1/YidC/SpoIIIJ protein YidD
MGRFFPYCQAYLLDFFKEKGSVKGSVCSEKVV